MSSKPRVEAPLRGSEAELLGGFLDFQRATFHLKVAGLEAEQLSQRVASSSLTLAGLIKHLALVEDSWFHERFLGNAAPLPWSTAPFDDDPDWEFHSALEDEPSVLLGWYEQACERSRSALEHAESLDALSVQPDKGTGELFSLRWVMLHMLEETARHNGHADLLREAVDGSVGE